MPALFIDLCFAVSPIRRRIIVTHPRALQCSTLAYLQLCLPRNAHAAASCERVTC